MDDRDCLARALAAIPPRQRVAFLAMAAGAPVAAAAAALGINENAFRQLYYRARRSLRQQLEGVLGVAPLAWWHRIRSTALGAGPGFGPAMTITQGLAAVAIVAAITFTPAVPDQAEASTAPNPSAAPVEAERPTARTSRPHADRARTRRAAQEVTPPTQRRVAVMPQGLPASAQHDKAAHAEQEPAKAPPANARPARAPVVQAPAISVEGVPVRANQRSLEDPDFHMGVRADVPGAGRQQVGYKAKDSHAEPAHEVACEAAASTPVTYCEP